MNTTLTTAGEYSFGRTMRGDLKAKSVFPLGDAQRPRRELHVETSKFDGNVECSAVVYERTEDGKGLQHSFALSSFGEGDFRQTLERVKGRATEKTIRAVHERNLVAAPAVLNAARGFYVAQEAIKAQQREAQAPALACLRDADFFSSMVLSC